MLHRNLGFKEASKVMSSICLSNCKIFFCESYHKLFMSVMFTLICLICKWRVKHSVRWKQGEKNKKQKQTKNNGFYEREITESQKSAILSERTFWMVPWVVWINFASEILKIMKGKSSTLETNINLR